MKDAVSFFEAEAVKHALTLPLPDARRFLLGMLQIADAEALPQTRVAFTNLTIADDQLELIAHGQMKLDLSTTTEAAA